MNDVQALAPPFGRDALLGGQLEGAEYQKGDELYNYLMHEVPRSTAEEALLWDGHGTYMELSALSAKQEG